MQWIYSLLCLVVFINVSATQNNGGCSYGTVFNGTGCDECGITKVSPNARIVGGIEAIPYSWPYQVLTLQTYKFYYAPYGRTISQTFYCAGTLINRRTVLTAAHCVQTDYIDYNNEYIPVTVNEYIPTLESMFTVYAGVFDITFLNYGDTPSLPGKMLKVAHFFKHESYDDSIFHNDIALFILTEPVELNDYIQIACLPEQVSSIFPSPNQNSWAAGWGANDMQGSFPDTLYNVKLTVYNSSMCNAVKINFAKYWDSQICAGEYAGGKDTCQGDSGGGLYALVNATGKQRFVAAGIVSYGEGCALPQLPGIYTKTSYYLDWIYSKLLISNNSTSKTTVSTSKIITSTIIATTTKNNGNHWWDIFSDAQSLKNAKYNAFAVVFIALIFMKLINY